MPNAYLLFAIRYSLLHRAALASPRSLGEQSRIVMGDVQAVIERAWEERDTISSATRGEVRDAVDHALDGLDTGSFRVAEKRDGKWQTNQWLKKAVLLYFRLNGMTPIP